VAARWREYVAELGPAVAEGRRGDALALFMRVAGIPEAGIAAAHESPSWPGAEALAHTLAYDAACVGDGPPPARLASIDRPVLA